MKGTLLEDVDFGSSAGKRLLRWSPSFDVIPFDWVSLVLELDHPDSSWTIESREEDGGIFKVHSIECCNGSVFKRWTTLWWDRGELNCAELRVEVSDESALSQTVDGWREGLVLAPQDRRVPPEPPVQHDWRSASLLLPQLWSPAPSSIRRAEEAVPLQCFELRGDQVVAARMFLWESRSLSRDVLEATVAELRAEGLEVQGGPAVRATELGRSVDGTWLLCNLLSEGMELGSSVVHLNYGEIGYVICCLYATRESDHAAWAAGRRATQLAIQTLAPRGFDDILTEGTSALERGKPRDFE